MAGQGSHFTHFDADGQAHMVDIASKDVTKRIARAGGRIAMRPETLAGVRAGAASQGGVLGGARITVDFHVDEAESAIAISVTAETLDRTGVEMEALTGAAIGLLTIYDMCKAVDRGMRIEKVRLLEKSGGKSGDFVAG